MHTFYPRLLEEQDYTGRWHFLLILMLVSMMVLIGRIAYLQVFHTQFLKHQGDIRHLDSVPISAYRGRITDRNGELLAVSIPVKSIWLNPKEFVKTSLSTEKLDQFALLLELPREEILKRLENAKTHDGKMRGFIYLKRKIPLEQADRILQLGIPGVYAEREYQRYYPAAEVTSHLVGLTNVEGKGQEGLELAFDTSLRGTDGERQIVRDGKRHIIGELEEIRSPTPGQDLTLSVDGRLQYLAYRELKKAVSVHRARAASLALLDVQSGEVLALVNEPSFNPNDRGQDKSGSYRNRAITDVYEPGSTMKPFAVACALELGLTHPNAMFNTAGQMRVGHNIVRDVHRYSALDVTGILQKSSNVGVTQIALKVPPRKFWAFYNNLGFGQALGTRFPGEVVGRLPHYQGWNAFEQATLSFGYGVSASTLHLARAYTAFANNGIIPMLSLLKRSQPPETHQVMSEKTAVSIRTMLEKVVSREGTALKAAVPGYRVAGKTGTVKKTSGHGYTSSLYISLFAGMAPVSHPRLVMIVMVDEPSAGEYYGGTVSAPVFSAVMEGALRLMNIAPDGAVAPLMAADRDGPA